MSSVKAWLHLGVAALTLAAAPLALASAARADACEQLWYKRNALYADAGYCFNTERARSVFGPGCRPPYGQLSPWAQARVNQIQAEEAGLGCPR